MDKLAGPYSGDAKQFIILDVALNAARHRELETAEFYARRDDDLTRRAFVFTTIAASLVEGTTADFTHAREFLEEATELAAKLNKEGARAVVLFGLATVYSRFDLTLASQVLTLAIQSANKVEEFGRDVTIRRGLNIGGFLFDYSLYRDEFTFTKAIKMVSSQNFDGTLSQVRMLKGRFLRLKATVVACEAAPGKSPKGVTASFQR